MLNDEQEEVVRAIQNIIGSTNKITVSGPGGTGKSYSITRSVSKEKIVFATPTHASAEVLRKELPDDTIHEVRTLHQLLGWGMKESFGNKEEWCTGVSKCKNKVPWETADLIVVDEASMITRQLVWYLDQYTEHFKLPVVYSGDASQLPAPIGGYDVFDQGLPSYTLTKNMRFNPDSGIAAVATTLRGKITKKNHKAFQIPDLDNWEDVRFFDNEAWLQEMQTSYNKGEDAVVIASEHKVLREIREGLVGEPYIYSKGQEVRCLETTTKFKNGSIFTITKADKPKETMLAVEWKQIYSARPKWLPLIHWKANELPLLHQQITLSNGKKALVIANELTDVVMSTFMRKIKKSRRTIKVPKVEHFSLNFLSTVHSAQGSSYDRVFIHTGSVLVREGLFKMHDKAGEHLRLVYVAVSRARKELLIQHYD